MAIKQTKSILERIPPEVWELIIQLIIQLIKDGVSEAVAVKEASAKYGISESSICDRLASSTEVNCPWEYCGERLIVTPDEDVLCPECGIEFEYRSSNKTYYWYYEPIAVYCEHCGEGIIPVQETANYQCPICRRYNSFERQGGEVYVS